MAAAQLVQKQQFAAVSKEKVAAEVRAALHGLKVEETRVAAAVKQAEQAVGVVAAAALELQDGMNGIICSNKECRVELNVLATAAQAGAWTFKGHASGCFTPGVASFDGSCFLLLLCLLQDLLYRTSFFFITIQPPNNSVTMALTQSEGGPLLGVLKTHLGASSTNPMPGNGMGPGCWKLTAST